MAKKITSRKKTSLKKVDPSDPSFTSSAWIEKPFWKELKSRENIWYCKTVLDMKDGKYNVTYQEKVGKYFIDFAFPEIRWGIELDGKRWHAMNNAQRKGDYKRERDLLSEGWIVIRFIGSEVKRNTKDCVDYVMSIIRKIYRLRNIEIFGDSSEKSDFDPIIKDGFCIHCGRTIPFNNHMHNHIASYCISCISSLANKFGKNDLERFCHDCGRESKISIGNPFCKMCSHKYDNFIGICEDFK